MASVLAAAEEIFSEEGLSAPIGEVARRAGVGVGTVYRHFPTKEALFEAVVKARIEAIAERAEQLTIQGDAAAALFTHISELVQTAVSKKDLVDELERWGVAPKEKIHSQLKERLSAAGEALLRRAQAVGAVRADLTYDDLTAMMVGACEGACCPMVDPKRRAQLAARMVEVLCAGLRAGAEVKATAGAKTARAVKSPKRAGADAGLRRARQSRAEGAAEAPPPRGARRPAASP